MQRSIARFFQPIIISINQCPCTIQQCRPLSRSLKGSRCCHHCGTIRGIRGTHGSLRLHHGLVRDVLLGGHHDFRRVYGLRREHGGLRREHGVLHGVRGGLRDHGDVRGLRGQQCMWLPAALRLLSVSTAAFRAA